MSDDWKNPEPLAICDICRLPRNEPPERPDFDWDEVLGNHQTCEEFEARHGR